jgi:hypothetical protein
MLWSMGSSSAQTVVVPGLATLAACEELKRSVVEEASRQWGSGRVSVARCVETVRPQQ